MNNNININLKNTISELKQFAKQNKLHVSGTKPILIKRIQIFINQRNKVIIIQKNIRGFFVRLWLYNRNSFLKNPTLNDIDFYTFEPIIKIPYKYYYNYKNHAFSIQSLIMLIYKSIITNHNDEINILNPYNREIIPLNVILDIFRFIRLYNIIFYNNENGCINDILEGDCKDLYEIIYSDCKLKENIIKNIHNTILKKKNLKKIEETRKLEKTQRIINLFMEIDLLGNYTSYTWFNNLSIEQKIIYWNVLYDIWLYRAGILNETKKKICPFYDPFYRKKLEDTNSHDVVIDFCLYAMENMVYMSSEEEYRKLGAMYVLTALTNISTEAKRALPWLADIIGW